MPPKRMVWKCKWPGCQHPEFEGKYQSQYLAKHQKLCPCNPANASKASSSTPAQYHTTVNVTNNGTFNNNINPTNITNNHQVERSSPPPLPSRAFGNEDIENILSELKPEQLETLLHFPEDALTQDLPNLLWFNLDTPDNSTVYMDKQNKAYSAGRGGWRPLEPLDALRVVSRHFRSVMEACRENPEVNHIGAIRTMLLSEYMRIIEEPDAKDIRVSKYAPYYGLTDGTISPKTMASELMRTVRENWALPNEDWVRTRQYADSTMGP